MARVEFASAEELAGFLETRSQFLCDFLGEFAGSAFAGKARTRLHHAFPAGFP